MVYEAATTVSLPRVGSVLVLSSIGYGSLIVVSLS
jgi:hypothetical protein